MSLTEDETNISSLKTDEQVLQTVITCMANVTLVSTTCDKVTTSGTATKDSHPVIKPVCNIPEMTTKTVATSPAHGVQPILTKPEPQITIVNEYAWQGVDELEKKQQVLQSPLDKAILDTQQPSSTTVASAKEAISSAVAELKNMVTTVSDAIQKAAQRSVEATQSTLTGSNVDQKGESNTLPTLWESDTWLDPFLPMKGGLAELTSALEKFKAAFGEPLAEPNSYCVHLGKLPSKVCQRFVAKMRDTVQNVQDALFHLQITIDLIEYSKQTADQKRPDVQEELNKMWLTWSLGELEISEREALLKLESMECRILLVFRNIVQRLRTACFALHFNSQAFPGQVQEHVYQLESIVDYAEAYTCTAASFRDFPGTMLVQSKLKILKARLLLHDLLDYVIENITDTWPASSEGLAEGTKVTEETSQPLSRRSK